MKFKIDENLPTEVAELLRAIGHDALTILDQELCGENDRRILDICKAEDRALITLDLDFSDVRSYQPQDYFGIIVFRLRRQDKTRVLEIMRRVMPLLEQEQVRNRLWIVEENRIRIRGE